MLRAVSFELDSQDHLVAVGPSWDAVARAHGAPWLDAPSVCGRRLWSFFSDIGTMELYRVLFAHVRRRGAVSVTFPFDAERCCDMSLTVTPLGDGRLECRTAVSIEHPSAFTRQPASALAFVVCCSWCGHLRVQGDWLAPDVALTTTPLLLQPRGPDVSHGMCPACEHRERHESS